MRKIVNSMIKRYDYALVKRSEHEDLISKSERFIDYELASSFDAETSCKFLYNLQFSKSQFRQDLFVLSELGFKKDGFFVEFGATNGIDLSNTYLMEKTFGWNGILAEPAKTWHSSLKNNRSAKIETDCVWSASDQTLIFNEVSKDQNNGELSTINSFSCLDAHKSVRSEFGRLYEVNTISLTDMLRKHEAPQKIDYLSIDTEGSEFEILSSFDFNDYDIKIITCEHNYTSMREKIYNLLTENGYERKLSKFSKCDDWYVKNSYS